MNKSLDELMRALEKEYNALIKVYEEHDESSQVDCAKVYFQSERLKEIVDALELKLDKRLV